LGAPQQKSVFTKFCAFLTIGYPGFLTDGLFTMFRSQLRKDFQFEMFTRLSLLPGSLKTAPKFTRFHLSFSFLIISQIEIFIN